MKFPTAHDAYFTGFRDGYKGVTNRSVPNFNREYEHGFVSGAMERKRVAGLNLVSSLKMASA